MLADYFTNSVFLTIIIRTAFANESMQEARRGSIGYTGASSYLDERALGSDGLEPRLLEPSLARDQSPDLTGHPMRELIPSKRTARSLKSNRAMSRSTTRWPKVRESNTERQADAAAPVKLRRRSTKSSFSMTGLCEWPVAEYSQ